MKRDKIIYWSTTSLIAAGMTLSGVMYLIKNPQIVQGFELLGYPAYFANVLGLAKLAGAIALVAPIWKSLKEWAYAGFTFTFISAISAHVATNTPWIAPFIALLILFVSYWFWKRQENQDQNQAVGS